MKIKGKDGKVFFKALIRYDKYYGFEISQSFYASKEQAILGCFGPSYNEADGELLWPVDMLDENTVYIPSEEELQDEN